VTVKFNGPDLLYISLRSALFLQYC